MLSVQSESIIMLNKFLILLAFIAILHESRQEKLIIDTDAGVDDAYAILLLLRYEASKPTTNPIEIVGITCTHGNTNEPQAEINVLKVLTIAGREDIPVYGGATKAIIKKTVSRKSFYGFDGFGDVEFTRPITAKVDKSKHAAVALVELAKRYSGEISIASFGPPSNIGIAINLDADFTSHVNKFYVMGGSVRGVGNVAPNTEANFADEPEGTFLLFNSSREAQISLFPWETAISSKVEKSWRTDVFANYDSPFVRFLMGIEEYILPISKKIWFRVDAMAAATIIDPSLIVATDEVNVTPVLQGEARGSVVVDYNGRTGKLKNAKIIQDFDSEAYKKLLVRYLTCGEIAC